MKRLDFERELELASNVFQIAPNAFRCEHFDEAVAWLRIGPFSGLEKINGEYRYWNKLNYVFRGQENSDWGISTTIQRSVDKETSGAATQLFSDLTEYFINTVLHRDVVKVGPTFEKKFGLAAAQHYGMDTNLSDWTTQCEIAAHFALDPKGEFVSGKIFLLPVERTIDNGLQIIFPPPMVKRVYNQRGVFIEWSADSFKDLQSELITIEFRQSSLHDSRNALNPIIYLEDYLLPECDWFKQLKCHCLARVHDNDFVVKGRVALESMRYTDGFKHPYLQNLLKTPLDVFPDEQLQLISNMLKSLTVEYKEGKTMGNAKIYEHIKKSNPIMLSYMEQLASS